MYALNSILSDLTLQVIINDVLNFKHLEDKEQIRSDVFGSSRRVRCNSQVDELGNLRFSPFSKKNILDDLALESRRSTFKRAQTEDKFRL